MDLHPIHSGAAQAARLSALTNWLPDWSVRTRKVFRPQCLRTSANKTYFLHQILRHRSLDLHPSHSGAARAARPSAPTSRLPDWSVRTRKVVPPECLRTSANKTYFLQQSLRRRSLDLHPTHSGAAQTARPSALTSWLPDWSVPTVRRPSTLRIQNVRPGYTPSRMQKRETITSPASQVRNEPV